MPDAFSRRPPGPPRGALLLVPAETGDRETVVETAAALYVEGASEVPPGLVGVDPVAVASALSRFRSLPRSWALDVAEGVLGELRRGGPEDGGRRG